jgi:hypothetical protein
VKRWLLLIYRIPRQPTAGRVFVWRKLKQLGAIALQDAAWVLPNSPRTQEQFQWLAAEITELQGEAFLCEAEQLYATDVEGLRRQFVEAVEAEYNEILSEVKSQKRELTTLGKRFQEALSRDFFGSQLAQQVRETLLQAGEDSAC